MRKPQFLFPALILLLLLTLILIAIDSNHQLEERSPSLHSPKEIHLEHKIEPED